jgi:glutamate synthase domain-containing protein 2
MGMRRQFIGAAVTSTAIIGGVSVVWPPVLWSFTVLGPLIAVGIYDLKQKHHTLLRNYPLVGHGRYWMEDLRPKIYQYFVESDTNGRPISRVMRSVVYQRAKLEVDTTPFGTQEEVYGEGSEWVAHALNAIPHETLPPNPRVEIGGGRCEKPYMASLLNISAMSFGSLSANAVMALNGGARRGGFAHNTGEGGISPYHLAYGGDLIWQVGTGYFGCRTAEGAFDEDSFAENARRESVKMIELKLSQGAKPGHGGLLPAKKNTPEIARIRGVEPYTTVQSPPGHSAFSSPKGLLEFLTRLRELSGGKPVGFKLCVGRQSDFLAICKAMLETGLYPDFITVDGAEGGTGAAPLEFSNSVGMPLREGLSFVHDALVGFGLRRQVRVLAAGKVMTGFQLLTTLALGADACYSARGMMLALGCIQALVCNKDTCPTGITTQDPDRMQGLVVEDKIPRVYNFHHLTLRAFNEMLAASGLHASHDLHRGMIMHRIGDSEVRSLAQLYPYLPEEALLQEPYPEEWREPVLAASADSFLPTPVSLAQ